MAAFKSGKLEFIDRKELPKNVLAYKRKLGSEEILVVMNFGKSKKEFKISENFSKLLLSVSPKDKIADGEITLSDFGAIVIAK